MNTWGCLIFKNLAFWALGTRFSLKLWGSLEVKNCPIMLKFGTFVDWMNTLGVLILLFENLSF